ncbi:unconventional myosin-ie [Anaeramoeba flamelloides]|uniref:Unconventional myosin-ie n=1 Tax=Anaeramoeba flamelloides TaxID=1746091 RepID=A0ABQ8Z4X9_9EUKA|nr:unconventional myosin-ie [Anaeramoeba flamelloides]
MSYDWEQSSKRIGIDDLTLLTKVNEGQIVENLKKRLQGSIIYTYIGFVLVAVNPYRLIKGMYGPVQIKRYRGKYSHELPPHVYSLADRMYRDLTTKRESQAVIITGESGAGKTETAKLIMQYISSVSGGGSSQIEHVKKVVLESNQVLESFGNATTLQNNNSSRFGKYMTIQFDEFGAPSGGRVRNYLLEKSRVVYQQQGERNFHIFYQLTMGASNEEKEYYGLDAPENFNYMNQGGKYVTDGMDEVEEYTKTKEAMKSIGMTEEESTNLFRTVAIILHLGNIDFYEDEQGNAAITDESQVDWTASLIGVESQTLSYALTFRTIHTGGIGRQGEVINVNQDVNGAYFSRDALAKAIYTRSFDRLVQHVNRALGETNHELVLGILDIFGFEIFLNNGFEQFCINFVNEKLQQIFIELTLKLEQEEYVQEGIKWTPIKYFNNKIVCDLIEGRNPLGILTILNDVCLMPKSQIQSQDEKLLAKLDENLGSHEHYSRSYQDPMKFILKHYAGDVEYNSVGFTDKNIDTLFNDLILLCQGSSFEYLKSLFPEVIDANSKKRPTSTGTKVIKNASELVENLMKCIPHYIRCIRPNSTKKPLGFEDKLTSHQVRYLGLLENIRVRRAGFAFRQPFERFVHYYGVLCEKTWPRYNGSPKEGCKVLLDYIQLDPKEWQLGNSKVFIKHPESLFHVEELRERKYHDSARRIQKCYLYWKARKHYLELRQKASDLLVGKKQRRRLSVNRIFTGDNINYKSNPKIVDLLESGGHSTEEVLYTNRVYRVGYSRWRKKARREDRDIILTERGLYIFGKAPIKVRGEKKMVLKISREIPIATITGAHLSTLADNFVNLKITNYDLLIEDDKKTELITILNNKAEESNRQFNLNFTNTIQSKEKTGKFRTISFEADTNSSTILPNLKGSAKALTVYVVPGLPADTRPSKITYKERETKKVQRKPVIQQQQQQTTRRNPPQISSRGRGGGRGGRGGFGRGGGGGGRGKRQPPKPQGRGGRGGGRGRGFKPTKPQIKQVENEEIQGGGLKLGGGGGGGSSRGRGRREAPKIQPRGGRGGTGGGRGGWGQKENTNEETGGGGGRGRRQAPKPRGGGRGGWGQKESTGGETGGGGGRGRRQAPKPRGGRGGGGGGWGQKQNTTSARGGGGGGWGSNNTNTQVKRAPPKPKPKIEKPSVPTASVLFSFEASMEGEVSIQKGTTIKIVKKDESGWWTVENHLGETGLAPYNYLKELN